MTVSEIRGAKREEGEGREAQKGKEKGSNISVFQDEKKRKRKEGSKAEGGMGEERKKEEKNI
jgi:hypothetical protein